MLISQVSFKRALCEDFFFNWSVLSASPYPIMYFKQVLKRETFLGRRLPIDNYWDWLDDHIKVKIWKIKTEIEIRDLRPQLFGEMIRYVNEKVYKKKIQ